jgi:VanZ family protein
MLKKLNFNPLYHFWLPFVLWALLIFSFSAQPAYPVSEVKWQEFVFKKTIHVIEYGIFSALLYRALINSRVAKTNAGYMAIFISILYGITDEFHQSFSPGRLPSLRDVIFDTIGAILAIYFIWKLLPIAPKKLKQLAKSLQLN